MTDDPLHRLQVAEAPELEAFLDIDQLLAHVVRIPPLLRIDVDRLEHGNELGVARVGLGEIAIEAGARNRQTTAREMAQELVVERRGAEQRRVTVPNPPICAKYLQGLPALLSQHDHYPPTF